jgi:hypothetical protein
MVLLWHRHEKWVNKKTGALILWQIGAPVVSLERGDINPW